MSRTPHSATCSPRRPRAEKPTKPVEVALWETAENLRGAVEPAEYKHVVLSLFFLKYAGDRFDAQHAKLAANPKTAPFTENTAFYTADNVFFLPPESRFSFILENSRQSGLALRIDTAFNRIEQRNPSLKGALPDNYYSRLKLDERKLANLIAEIARIPTAADHDTMGRIYEYFLQKFAISEGSGKGEFYTPKSIVRLIAELIQPYSGVIYDPCCGSGGMFVSSVKFIESHHGDRDLPTIYGQEYTPTTYKLAKMNLAIRGISANLGGTAADTFHRDQHPDLKADFIMANPPFNQKRWRGENELIQDARWAGYPVPPSGNANYGWILHIASKLTPNGAAGFLLANGALGGEDGDELAIRRKLIENDLVEAIFILPRELFYSTDISVTLWLLNRNKRARTFTRNGERVTHRDRTGEILFADLRTWGVEFEKKYITLADDEIARAAQLFHDWQQTGVESVPELCHSANLPEIKEKNYSLVPSKYISFLSRDASLDYDAEMETLRRSFSAILRDETAATAQLQSAFATLGYAIKGGIDK